jgi:putative ABC transport system substrate-binding protein
VKRRYLFELITGATVAVPFAAHAQQNKRKVRIGYLSPGKGPDTPLFDELAILGYREGRNLEVVYGVFGDDPNRLPEFVAGFLRAPVDLILARGSEATVRAARAVTNTIPIVVIAINYDPIERGYVASLAHPGGDVTGVYFQSLELTAKQVELLKAIAPQATRLTVLWGEETQDEFVAAEDAAKALGLTTRSFRLGAPPYDYEAMFRRLAEDAPPLVLVLSTPAFAGHGTEVAAAELRYRLPAMHRFRGYVEAGGLMSYGVDDPAMSRLAARYVAKILGGARPADLPVERADRFDLAINLQTAKALGITVPPHLLARADEVIE